MGKPRFVCYICSWRQILLLWRWLCRAPF